MRAITWGGLALAIFVLILNLLLNLLSRSSFLATRCFRLRCSSGSLNSARFSILYLRFCSLRNLLSRSSLWLFGLLLAFTTTFVFGLHIGIFVHFLLGSCFWLSDLFYSLSIFSFLCSDFGFRTALLRSRLWRINVSFVQFLGTAATGFITSDKLLLKALKEAL